MHALAHGPEETLHQAAARVIEAAAALDERHESVLDAVQRAQRLLEGTGRGEVGRAQVSYALLRTALPDLGDGLAQQDRAYSQLVESLSAYRLPPTAGFFPRPSLLNTRATRATGRARRRGPTGTTTGPSPGSAGW
ncbi:hypothetical protein AB0918_07375 [Streptomyces sp. NPDC006864]|uniref:hypothetical protein n=1 Tax=Streptomyces sp. NPDC006864 TaxID=3154780 RepID=UPI003456CC48